MKPLECAKEPCSSCPYRKDVLSGLWHPSEYAKLPAYDDGVSWSLGTFLCHQTNATGRKTVCRGWLTVAADSIAVRIAILKGEVAVEQRDAPVATPLHKSGAAACAAGMRGVRRPGRKARALGDKLLQKGAGKLESRS